MQQELIDSVQVRLDNTWKELNRAINLTEALHRASLTESSRRKLVALKELRSTLSRVIDDPF